MVDSGPGGWPRRVWILGGALCFVTLLSTPGLAEAPRKERAVDLCGAALRNPAMQRELTAVERAALERLCQKRARRTDKPMFNQPPPDHSEDPALNLEDSEEQPAKKKKGKKKKTSDQSIDHEALGIVSGLYARIKQLHRQARNDRWATMVVSGGVSMGSWQAGFVTAVTRYLAVKRPALVPRIWVGASAGSVNAFLGGALACEPEGPYDLNDTPMWKVWVEGLGLSELLEPDGGSDHLFRKSYMAKLLTEIGDDIESRRYRQDCRVAVGLTVTNLAGRKLKIKDKVSLSRVTEKIVLQMTLSDRHVDLRLPYVDHMLPSPPPDVEHLSVNVEEASLYAVPGPRCPLPGGVVPLSDALTLVRASGTFPLAFPPVETALWVRTSVDSKVCGERWRRQYVQLIDGGVLNNNPLDLAQRMVDAWRTTKGQRLPPYTNHIYLDQGIVGWRWKKSSASKSKMVPLMKTYGRHLGTLLNAARDSSLVSAIEASPGMIDSLQVPTRERMTASEYRFAMMGFFDRRFRVHDFYIGLLRGADWLRDRLGQPDLTSDEVFRVMGLDQETRRQVSWLIDPCALLSESQDDQRREEDQQLLRLGCALQGLTEYAKEQPQPGLHEDDVLAFLSALAAQGYVFGEGSLQGRAAAASMSALRPIRQSIGQSMIGVARAQDFVLGRALAQPTEAFVDEWLAYAPPDWSYALNYSLQRGVIMGAEWPLVGLGLRKRSTGTLSGRLDLRLAPAISVGGVSRLEAAGLPGNYGTLRWWRRLGFSLGVLTGYAGSGVKGGILRFVGGAAYGFGWGSDFISPTHRVDLRLGLGVLDFVWIGVDVPVYSYIGGDHLTMPDAIHDWAMVVGLRLRH